MEFLIANTGLQFWTKKVEFNASSAWQLPSGRPLRYTFAESKDEILGEKVFDFLIMHSSGKLVPRKEIIDNDAQEILGNNNEALDETGCIKFKSDAEISLSTTYQAGDPEVITINSLGQWQIQNAGKMVPAFELLCNKWLPMPFFEYGMDGVSIDMPKAWVRVKIVPAEGARTNGESSYNIVWAFDTETGDCLEDLRPSFDYEESKVFGLCNRADLMINFMFDGESCSLSPYAQYIAQLLGLDCERMLNDNKPKVFQFVAYYIYLVNYLRVRGFSPEVTLCNKPQSSIPVDLVLDMGNSRTCGVLFEDGDSRKAKMLELVNLSSPWICYQEPFDMRLAFRQADFGNGLILDKPMFNWRSIVRLGKEARSLVYHTRDEGLNEETTNYSSPKRYLWDEKPFEGQWTFLTTLEDPYNVGSNKSLYLKGVSNYFTQNGEYNPDAKNFCMKPTYSRSSLMTFVMLEILHQAIMQINSIKYRVPRSGWAKVECGRYLRNLVITCPTAMPRTEQIRLRQAAVDAYDLMRRNNPSLPQLTITPSPEALSCNDQYEAIGRQWCYDEASCSQLVYLYAELAERYNCETSKFFEYKGHIRPEFKEQGFTDKSLTIGSVDIGAGTTDLMICSYQQSSKGKIVPIPLFWDSFNLAGDDILRNIVQNIIIDGPLCGSKVQGSISSVTLSRLKDMTDEQLRALPVNTSGDSTLFKDKIESVCRAFNPNVRDTAIKDLALNLVRCFFGNDAAYMTARGRRNRVDFNTQVSVPIAQMFMGLVAKGLPARKYTFDELFEDEKPSSFLLDAFAEHFGYRFEEIVWDFDPEAINREVRHTMETLMKQLSIVLSAYHCDIVVLSGRPTSLPALPELFIKHCPVTPDRLVRLNKYRVGDWYPFIDGLGNFRDHKSVVAVGAMVGFQASTTGFHGLSLDFSRMISDMNPTSNYIGYYRSDRQRVDPTWLSPDKSSETITVTSKLIFIGCRQLDSVSYQARPLYAFYNHTDKTLRVTISRSYQEDRELLHLEDVCDEQGNEIPHDKVELVAQSLAEDGKYWLDKGEFELSLKM